MDKQNVAHSYNGILFNLLTRKDNLTHAINGYAMKTLC